VLHVLFAVELGLKFIPPFGSVNTDKREWKEVLEILVKLGFPAKDPSNVELSEKLNFAHVGFLGDSTFDPEVPSFFGFWRENIG